MGTNKVSLFKVSKIVVNKAFSLGICDDPDLAEAKVLEYVENSARITHPEGNRRYEDWIFAVAGGNVSAAHYIGCHNCNDHYRIIVHDECQTCLGKGCPSCRKGSVRKLIPCPECSQVVKKQKY